jgi:hypothetical protein
VGAGLELPRRRGGTPRTLPKRIVIGFSPSFGGRQHGGAGDLGASGLQQRSGVLELTRSLDTRNVWRRLWRMERDRARVANWVCAADYGTLRWV